MATAVLLAQTEARFDVVSIKPAEQLTAAEMLRRGFTMACAWIQVGWT
jgi:hypothetical protein